jgi:hypothetical protein
MFITFFDLQEILINYLYFFRNSFIIITAYNTYNLMYIIFHKEFCPVNS